jgi:hypothetical protein
MFLQSFRTQLNARRRAYVLLAAQIEQQLREAYDKRFRAGLATQSSLADKLGVNRSAVHHRLMGHTNMTIETIADMVWALDYAIEVKIFDPSERHGANHCVEMALESLNASVGQPVGFVARPGLSQATSRYSDELKPALPDIAVELAS